MAPQVGPNVDFIASRLRNIPLVSADPSWAKAHRNSTSERRIEQSGSEAEAIKMGATNTKSSDAASEAETNQIINPQIQRAKLTDKKVTNQLGKRDAAFVQSRGDRIQSQAEVLFRQAGSTASIANVLRTTTEKPKVIRTTTTSTRPASTARASRPTVRYKIIKTTTTSTRKPVKPVRNNIKLAKMIQRQEELVRARNVISTSSSTTRAPEVTASAQASRASATLRLMEPISSLKMSTLQAISSSSRVHYAAKTSAAPTVSQVPTEAASPSLPTEQQQSQQTTLTRATQTLTTLPVNQRRPPVNIVQSRGASTSTRFGGLANDKFAGENWVLFNRTDGQFSAFEILVLISNILIVSTVLVVILFNWIKLFKRRRRARQTPQAQVPLSTAPGQQQQQSEQQGQQAPPVHHEERVSQISSGLSGFTSTTANETTTTFTANTNSNESRALKAAGAANNVAGELGVEIRAKGQNLIGQLQQTSEKINESSTVFNNVSNGPNVANKAMAIVQPSENTSGVQQKVNNLLDGANDKLKFFRDELGKQSRAVSRSVSDLSGGGKEKTEGASAAAKAQLKKSADDLSNTKRSPTTTPERISALEGLFKDTGGAGKSKRRTSTGSLDSIELPSNLVEPMKKQASKLANELIGPSPNLLLGEVETLSNASSKLQASETRATQNAKAESSQPKEEKSNEQSAETRSENPMARELSKEEETSKTEAEPKPQTSEMDKKAPSKGANGKLMKEPVKRQADISAGNPLTRPKAAVSEPTKTVADVKNHQVVVNKLDKRKTNLEIVDLRDESVTGNMRHKEDGGKTPEGASSSWISMDGVAVVQTAPPASMPQSPATATGAPASGTPQTAPLSPSEIIESRFHVDYKSKRKQTGPKAGGVPHSESMDSKQEEYVFNNIENELEQDNKMRNRKYFVYIVHDGHFTAKKECIARIELPQRRRITLAELRQLIANSQDISLSSLRRNRFKFVTETYRLLNENEDAAVLHQVYPTQGVFLKLNVAENENQTYAFKGGRNARLSSGSAALLPGNSLSQATIASRRRATARSDARKLNSTGAQDGTVLPAIDVTYANQTGPRASSVGRKRPAANPAGAYRRSKSSVQTARRGANGSQVNDDSTLPSLGMSNKQPRYLTDRPHQAQHREYVAKRHSAGLTKSSADSKKGNASNKSLLESAASDLGANVLSGAKKLFTATFSR